MTSRLGQIVFPRIISFTLYAALLFLCASGCAVAIDPKDSIVKHERTLTASSMANKSIFVFLDGTRNGPETKTNVWRLYELISNMNDPKVTALYINGVGTTERPVFGAALGRGMEDRILQGYDFLAQNYTPGDDIYIFGFSRGAHEARSLAGLVAYAGLPKMSDRNSIDSYKPGNDILEILKERRDDDYLTRWQGWSPSQPPILAGEIRDNLGIDTQPAEVKFLGVWDTVPGSSFKTYAQCREHIGFVKRYFYWLPMISSGERYKTGSYPPLRNIAHAVSIDEKRSKFAPILLCPEINQTYTKRTEVWFPGAHADVGGGYDDSDELPSISLNWMMTLLGETYKFTSDIPRAAESANGLAHWSIGDFPANWRSNCQNRKIPLGSEIHKSFEDRKRASPVPLRMVGGVKMQSYPMECP